MSRERTPTIGEMHFFFFFFPQYWSLNSGPHICYASALPLDVPTVLFFLTQVSLHSPGWPRTESASWRLFIVIQRPKKANVNFFFYYKGWGRRIMNLRPASHVLGKCSVTVLQSHTFLCIYLILKQISLNCPGWPWIYNSPASASGVARITDRNHHTLQFFFEVLKFNFKFYYFTYCFLFQFILIH
jgi:hypothetical protein